MPFYELANVIDVATTTTETDQTRFLTVANQKVFRVVGVQVTGRTTTVGGIKVRLARFTTPSTGGGALPFSTPDQTRDPSSALPQTTAFEAPTIGSGRSNQLTVGGPLTGGDGVWQAINRDHAISLSPNGGANGNLDMLHQSSSAVAGSLSVLLELMEGN